MTVVSLTSAILLFAPAGHAQSPPTPEAAPPLALVPLQEAVRDLRCAVLAVAEREGRIAVSGTAADDAVPERVEALLDQLAPGQPRLLELRLAAPALCEPLTLIAAARAANAAAAKPLSIQRLAPGTAVLHGGDELVFDIAAPDTAVHLQVDYLTADGNVVHLLPNPLETTGKVEAGGRRRMGDRKAGGRFWTIGPPYGEELIVVLAAPAPFFPTPRPEVEAASAYLPELKRALDGAAAPVYADALFIATAAP